MEKDKRPLEASELNEMYVDGVKELLKVSFADDNEAIAALKIVITRTFHQLSGVRKRNGKASTIICNKVVSKKAQESIRKKLNLLKAQKERKEPEEAEEAGEPEEAD